MRTKFDSYSFIALKFILLKVVPYTSGKNLICSFNFLIYLAVCLNISTVINIKMLANSNQQTQSYKCNSHIAAFLSVVLITEMLEICIRTSYDQNVQLILNSYLPVVYGTTLSHILLSKLMCSLSIVAIKLQPLSCALCRLYPSSFTP